ncbi:MAG: LPS export ABC transporter permease LptG [Nitrospirota bacterium]|nr:LPS export ABC transporter permease LptG [Nitrospirota bacterium]
MRILNRYILREFLKFLSLSLTALVGIYLVVDFFERLDNFNEFHARGSHIAIYFLYETPKVVFLLLPIAVLLATILCIGLLAKNSEIIAMRAGGVSLYRIAMPILVSTFILSIFSFWANDLFVPYANRQATYMKEQVIEKKPARGVLQANKVWLKLSDGKIMNIEYMDSEKGKLSGVSIFSFDTGFHIQERIEAAALEWKEGAWILQDAVRYRFKAGEPTTVETISGATYPLAEKPSALKAMEINPEEMSFGQLRKYIATLKARGYSTVKYSADLHGKVAFIFVTFIMSLVAVPLALKNIRTSGIGTGVGLSILIGFSYWVIYSVSISLAYSGRIPPIFAAWLGNILYISGGAYLMMSVKQ